nr:MAG TPA: hypothetical protein [Caudoviricetes sp.]
MCRRCVKSDSGPTGVIIAVLNSFSFILFFFCRFFSFLVFFL